MAKITGSCLCASVSFSCGVEPLLTVVCRGGSCQRQIGTAFSINAPLVRHAAQPMHSSTEAEPRSFAAHRAARQSSTDARKLATLFRMTVM